MQGGGAERVAALLCNHWAERGYQITLMPTFSGRGDCLYPLNKGVNLVYLADRVGSRSPSFINKVRRLYALRQAIRELKPDVIVSFLTDVNIAAIIAARGSGIPVVVAERSYPPMMDVGRLLAHIRRCTYPYAKQVVMQTEQGRKWAQGLLPSARVVVIPNPVVWPIPSYGLCVAPETVVAGGRRVLLAVGRLSEEKQISWIIEAFAEWTCQFHDWDLVVLGEGPERERLEAQRYSLGLEGKVHLPGRVENVSDWYQRASLFVMSSRFEGFPNALLEAMSCGLPVVSVDCDTGPRDLIQNGIDGVLVDPQGGVPALADALAGLMADSKRRVRLGEAANKVRERYAISRIAAEWDRVLGLVE